MAFKFLVMKQPKVKANGDVGDVNSLAGLRKSREQHISQANCDSRSNSGDVGNRLREQSSSLIDGWQLPIQIRQLVSSEGQPSET